MTEEDFAFFVRSNAELIGILLHIEDKWAADPAINQALRAAEAIESTAIEQLKKFE
jgi:hypothetical protein